MRSNLGLRSGDIDRNMIHGGLLNPSLQSPTHEEKICPCLDYQRRVAAGLVCLAMAVLVFLVMAESVYQDSVMAQDSVMVQDSVVVMEMVYRCLVNHFGLLAGDRHQEGWNYSMELK